MSDLDKNIVNATAAAHNNNKDDWLYKEFLKKPKEVERRERAAQSIRDKAAKAAFDKKIADAQAANSLKIANDKAKREAAAEARRIERARADAEKAAKRKERAQNSSIVLLSQQASTFAGLCGELNEIFRKEDELTLAIFRILIKFIEDKVKSKLPSEELKLLHDVIKDVCGDESDPTQVSKEEQARILTTIKNFAAGLTKDLSAISREGDLSTREAALKAAVNECLEGASLKHTSPSTQHLTN